ncbi:MAG: DUF3592 domain-containing protein [Ramlibacter sp.]
MGSLLGGCLLLYTSALGKQGTLSQNAGWRTRILKEENVDRQFPMKSRIFGLLFIVAGLALGYVITKQTIESLVPYGWEQSECLIKKSDVVYDAKERACRHSLEYQYEVAGVIKTGTTWRLDPGVPYEWCRDWASHASNFPPAAKLSCHIDPKNPDRAVLDRGNLLSIFTLILPIGLLFIGIAILRRKSSNFSPNLAGVKRIAQVVAACTVLAGVLGTLFAGVLPLYESYASRTWSKAECEVLASALRTSGTGSAPGLASRSNGYFIEIVYTYAMDGRRYVSDRYDFDPLGSGSADSLAQVTSQYPTGAKVSCAVSPSNPYEAVLVAGPAAKYLWGFIFLLGLPIGFGLWIAVRRIK